MGGLFSSPSPPPAPPPPPPTPAPAPEVVKDPDQEARQQRLDAIARNRRGRYGLIETSERGVLDAPALQGKTLLGE
ncbi:MAG: hypothetical protein HY985_10960 [Magnetospirillum sp.]|nr:hypothetical protein [Magnetospirillum sp.]